jgi:hypothetical protein
MDRLSASGLRPKPPASRVVVGFGKAKVYEQAGTECIWDGPGVLIRFIYFVEVPPLKEMPKVYLFYVNSITFD